jgi:hypothetical protein
MQPPTYVTPEVEATLRSFVLTEVVPEGYGVRSFFLRPEAWDGKSYHLYLTFTPAGVALQGPLLCGPDGHGFLSDRSLEWFVSDLSEDAVLAHFCEKSWQYEVAERDLRALAAAATNPAQASALLQVADRVASQCQPGPQALLSTLLGLGVPPLEAAEVGYDYPVGDAGWLCGVQRRFAQLMRPPAG